MHTFIKLFTILSLFFGFFSCARRDQALFQRSQREQLTEVSPTVKPIITEPLQVASSRQEAIQETEMVTASVESRLPVEKKYPVWSSHSGASKPITKATVEQTRVQQKQIRKAILKKLVADTPVKTSGLAIAALVCGILSFFLLGIVLGPLSLIFGAVALNKIAKDPSIKGRGMAVAGLVLGIVATVIMIVYFASRT
ncbi:DUF4190 domain-containing protein [Spirosoma sp. KNUC1025]|uniref:DUF4190 domain-containing protein n=1 Tax=Spirosoma sp. KNUC1025 TaxID=2894082 RepID=UPI00386797E2|nr:DUF4190 domain-containing protein [Spirosoma sp. KNUC1025]